MQHIFKFYPCISLPGGSEWILLMIALPIYFLPSIIGYSKSDFKGILLLNLFLGWTFLGWLGALIWALKSKHKSSTH